MEKLGFCFLTIDNPVNIEVWKEWFNPLVSDFCIHAKNIRNLDRDLIHRLCPVHIPTRWGGFGLVEASYQMFKYMFEYNNIDKVALISDKCLPAKKFDYVYDTVMQDNSSFFYYKPIPAWKQQRCRFIENAFSSIWNQSQWMIITREAFEIIDKYFKHYKLVFQGMYCSDEHFFINILKEKGYSNITNKKYHYFHFLKDQPHPIELENEDFVNICEDPQYLFMRKFSNTLDKKFWPIII